MEHDPQVYIGHMLDAIDIIQEYCKGLEFEQFEKDVLVKNTVVRQLEIIGEASKRLPEEIKQLTAEIPWADVSAMRNHIVHDYFEIDLERVWDVVENHLPALKKFLESQFQGRTDEP